MSGMTLLARGGPFTRADLDDMPDDGHRYELIDGALIVTPSPSSPHQIVVGELFVLLHAACPRELRVLMAPFDVVLALDTVVEPDLLVAPRSAFTYRDLPSAPMLAVEVLSPSTRHIDLSLKKARYEEAAVASYWVLDPLAATLRVWELREGRYEEETTISGAETHDATAPFAVRVVPEQLLD